MKLQKGFFRICHEFPYSDDACFSAKEKVIENTLGTIRAEGYEGVVTNVPYEEGYLKNEDNWRLTRHVLETCRRLGLRVWLYDEKGYPSGAAGILTLSDDPSLEAQALAAVHRVLAPGEETLIPLPHGHLAPMGAFAYPFAGKQITADELASPLSSPAYTQEGYRFCNQTSHPMLCLAFFTKYAFEGTHCQHNAACVRRYVDLAHPRAGKAFVENTYKPYFSHLAPYFADGTIESFFMDEPSYMAVYFNLKKHPSTTCHLPDPLLPLYAMVTWSEGLEERFEEKYGYSLTQRLPFLFFGDSHEAQRVRRDFYLLLTGLAQQNFFAPIAQFCQSAGVYSSGHLLLEERITDHPRFQGNFFPLLKTMHVPGMDMLDSLPERVWKKSFTPLLLSSVSRLYREGDVMDEVSAHFQNKFSVPLSPRQIFTALAIQHLFGATLFTSYFDAASLLAPTPSQESLLCAFTRFLHSTEQATAPALYLHYPIEAIMSHTVSPVDVATVYDSILNEYRLPYPIDRNDLDRPSELSPIVKDSSEQRARTIEAAMEAAMFTLMDHQIPFGFADTDALCDLSPSVLVVYADAVDEPLLSQLLRQKERGWRIYALEGTRPLPDGLLPLTLEGLATLVASVCHGDTAGIAAAHTENTLLLANSDNREKSLSLSFAAASVTEAYENRPLNFSAADGVTRFTLPPLRRSHREKVSPRFLKKARQKLLGR